MMTLDRCDWRCLLWGLFGGVVAALVMLLAFPGPQPRLVPESICGTVWKDPSAGPGNPHPGCSPGTPVANAVIEIIDTYDGTNIIVTKTTDGYGRYCLGPPVFEGDYLVRVNKAASVLSTPSIATAIPWCDTDDPDAQATYPPVPPVPPTSGTMNEVRFSVAWPGTPGTVHTADFGYK